MTSATISEAPCSRRVSAALARVPHVSDGFVSQLGGKSLVVVIEEGYLYRPCRQRGWHICL